MEDKLQSIPVSSSASAYNSVMLVVVVGMVIVALYLVYQHAR